MNPFALNNNSCYQFWMLPSLYGAQVPYFAPVAFYPQMTRPPANNILIQTVPSNPAFILPVHQRHNIEKSEPKPANYQPPQKSEPLKLAVQSETNISKQVIKINQTKKANRPQTYLTEKAFYMQQKLKLKQKSGIRKLRRRLKFRKQKVIKSTAFEVSIKNQVDNQAKNKKRLPIEKGSEKQLRMINKIKLKLEKQALTSYALLPKHIEGISQLNQFCRAKYESLMSRRVGQA